MAAARAEQLKKEVVEYKWNIMQDGVIGSDGFRHLEDYSKWCVERNCNSNLTEIDYQKELTDGLYQNTSESLVAIGEAMSGSRISYQKVKELVIKIKGGVEQYGATKMSVAAGNFMEYCDKKSSDGCKIYHNRLKELNEEFSWKMAEYFGKKEQADEARKNVMPVWDLNLDPPP